MLSVVENLEQMLGGSYVENVIDLPLPKRDFRKLHVLTLCKAGGEYEESCVGYRPSSINGCAFQGRLENMKTCLNIGVGVL